MRDFVDDQMPHKKKAKKTSIKKTTSMISSHAYLNIQQKSLISSVV